MNKLFGSVLIMIGQVIGAGMLALPLVSSSVGLVPALSVLFVAWMVMTVSQMYVLEVSLAMKNTECGFGSMAEKTLGIGGKIITFVVTSCLLYSLISMYIAGTSSILVRFLNSSLPDFVTTIAFTLIFGSVVFCGTRATDRVNRLLMSIKGGTLIGATISLFPYIHKDYLLLPPMSTTIFGKQGFVSMVLVFLSSFNACCIIPTLRTYNNDAPQRMKYIVFLGTIIPMVIYAGWLIAVLGVIPQIGPQSFITINGSVGELIRVIVSLANNKLIFVFITAFANITMTVSFLTSSLALVDFLIDSFKLQTYRGGRLSATLLALVPPCMFAVFCPESFLSTLQCAAISAIILAIILPTVMVYRLRNNSNIQPPFRMAGGNTLLFILFFIGFLTIVLRLF